MIKSTERDETQSVLHNASRPSFESSAYLFGILLPGTLGAVHSAFRNASSRLIRLVALMRNCERLRCRAAKNKIGTLLPDHNRRRIRVR